MPIVADSLEEPTRIPRLDGSKNSTPRASDISSSKSLDEVSTYFQQLALDREVSSSSRVLSRSKSLLRKRASFSLEAQDEVVRSDSPVTNSLGCDDGTPSKSSGKSTDKVFSKMMTQVKMGAEAPPVVFANFATHASDEVSGKSLLLLPDQSFVFDGRHTLVLDLDETLVHATSSVTATYAPSNGDFHVAVGYEGSSVDIFVRVRPGLQSFLTEVGRLFEVVLFTAGVEPYASAVLDVIDPHRRNIHHLLHRGHCTRVQSMYVKDLSLLNRPLDHVIIVDNSPVAYLYHPRNAIPCTSWYEDRSDNELLDFLPMLQHVSNEPEVFTTLDQFHDMIAAMTTASNV